MLEAPETELRELESSLLDSLRRMHGELHYSVIAALQHAAQVAPDSAVLVEPERRSLTYGELLALARKTVAALNGLGFSRNSRLALVLPGNTAAAGVYLSLLCGCTIMPLDSALQVDEYERYFQQGGVAAVLLQQGATPAARAAAARCGSAIIDVVFDADPVGSFTIAGAPAQLAEPDFAQPADTALLAFSSGSTDSPKLIALSQRLFMLRAYSFRDPYAADDMSRVDLLPLWSHLGTRLLLMSVQRRGQFTCVPATDPATVYHYLAHYRPARLMAVPALLNALLEEAPRHAAELSRLRLKEIHHVSTLLPEQLSAQLRQLFGAAIVILYGSIELSVVTELVLAPTDPTYRAGAIGKPYEYIRLRIDAPVGEVGEIVARTPTVFDGYENSPELNAAVLRDGWYHTGDAGYMDADGSVFLVGRLREMINRGGTKIAPAEVEAALAQHPAVAEAAAFAFPHAALGEDLAAAVVLREPGLTARELRNFAAERLARYKVPARIIFVDAIPKNALGKIQRIRLAAMLKEQLGR